MARSKPQTMYPVKDLKAANACLGEIARIKRNLAEINTTMNEQIDALKKDAEAKAAPMQARLSAMESGLLAFAEYNKADLFQDKRSCELDFGLLGYRKSSEIRPKAKHTLAMILGRLKELGFTQAIRSKEEVNKDELHTWPDERLDLVGARRVEKDTFWYETKAEEITNKEAA